MENNSITELRKRLQVLNPIELTIQDDSDEHEGHAGAQHGARHCSILIISPLFEGKKLLDRHRMVYDAVGDLMQGAIHALQIKAKSPTEQ